jgi:UPF0042 nucleotide-binding protein
MQLVIISGRSGSGKSTALHLLEDEGYYCIDNLPVALLPELVNKLHIESGDEEERKRIAVCIDARNATRDLARFDELKSNLPSTVHLAVIYIDADDHTLLKRFSETRRRHPLSQHNISLSEAIEREKQLLDPIARNASLTINTNNLTVHDLRSLLKARVVERKTAGLSILIQSFGFKRGIPVDSDMVFDLRSLPNPHWYPELRPFTGRDEPVREFLERQPDVLAMFHDISHYLTRWLPSFEQNNRAYVTVSLGCTGGQHRSVYMAERLTRLLSLHYDDVQVRHREYPATPE